MTRALFLNATVAAVLLAVFGFVLSTVPTRAAQCGGTIMVASWYGAESGNRTANGEHFDGTSMTAAHRSLPFGTKLRVSFRGSKPVTVRINDRGPAEWTGRDLDLSEAAARAIGMTDAGVGRVCVERL